MAIVPDPAPPARPTNAAPLPRLVAYAQSLGLERHLARPKRSLSTLALALLWLVLAWRASGRPYLSRLRAPLHPVIDSPRSGEKLGGSWLLGRPPDLAATAKGDSR